MAFPASFLRQYFTEPLKDLGFERVRRRQVWMRSAEGVDHAVSIEPYGSRWTVRWDIVHAGVGEILHGREVEPSEVAYSGFIIGDASHHLDARVVTRFDLADVQRNDPKLVGVGLAVLQVAGWTDDFMTSGETIALLLERPGENTNDLRVTLPGTWPLRLFTAAALAAVTGHPQAKEFAESATRAVEPWSGGSTDRQLERLRTAVQSGRDVNPS